MAVMGEEYFKKGVNIYLNRYKYSNAGNVAIHFQTKMFVISEHKDLWNALTEVTSFYFILHWREPNNPILLGCSKQFSRLVRKKVRRQRICGALDGANGISSTAIFWTLYNLNFFTIYNTYIFVKEIFWFFNNFLSNFLPIRWLLSKESTVKG